MKKKYIAIVLGVFMALSSVSAFAENQSTATATEGQAPQGMQAPVMDENALMGVVVSVDESSITIREKDSEEETVITLGDETTVEKGMGPGGMGAPGSNGEAPSGEAPSGELPELPSGEAPSGEAPSGEAPSGERPELPSGEAPSGEALDQNSSLSLSDLKEGDMVTIVLNDDDSASRIILGGGMGGPEGQAPNGEEAPELPSGEAPTGERPELPSGEAPTGERPELPSGEAQADAPTLPSEG